MPHAHRQAGGERFTAPTRRRGQEGRVPKERPLAPEDRGEKGESSRFLERPFPKPASDPVWESPFSICGRRVTMSGLLFLHAPGTNCNTGIARKSFCTEFAARA